MTSLLPTHCLAVLLSALLIFTGCGRAPGAAEAVAAPSETVETDFAAADPAIAKPAIAVDDLQLAQADEAAPARGNPPKRGEAMRHPFPGAQIAPSLEGGLGWINTAGPLDLKDLRGKFVLLDFWTYCCINCIHILPELKKLEAAYPNELVVIGVHSAKFETEQDSQNITDAVLRYEIEHPVVNDANHVIWNRYRVNSWPSLRVIDPEGNLVAGDSGEVQFEVLDRFFKQAIPYYRQKGTLDETPLRFDLAAYSADVTPLRFPGKLLADEASDRLYIADSNHNRIVVSTLDGQLQEIIGSGEIGAADGDYAKASFNKPQGMALRDKTLYVADTENHLIRKIDLEKKQVSTIAGRGFQARSAWPGLNMEEINAGGAVKLPSRFVGAPKRTAINSPWALWIHEEDLYIAMAGPHQIWKMTLDESEIGPYAGNGREDIVDGPLLPKRPYEEGYSSFAQPSGLTSDGTWLYVADSEGSSIRAVPLKRTKKSAVQTVVGTAHLRQGRLFVFGDVDGEGEKVRLQHALGVAWHDGVIYVADTYNNKIKVVDPQKGSSKTIAGDGKPGAEDKPARFDEPAGVSVAAGKLYVADTNNHLIRVIDLDAGYAVSTLEIKGLTPPKREPPKTDGALPGARQIKVPTARVKSEDGQVRIAVKLELPKGYKINEPAPMSYRLEAAEGEGPIDRVAIGKSVKIEKPAAEFEAVLPVTAASGKDQVKLSVTYYYCQDGNEGLCKVGSAIWTISLELTEDGEAALALSLEVEPRGKK